MSKPLTPEQEKEFEKFLKLKEQQEKFTEFSKMMDQYLHAGRKPLAAPEYEPKESDPEVKEKDGKILYKGQEVIAKKVAALEVMKRLQYTKIMSIGSIAGAFIILLTGTFSSYLSMGAAGILSVGAGVMLAMSQNEIKSLKAKYSI